MLSITMPHNDTLLLKGSKLGPYREHKYLQIIKIGLQGGKIPNDEEARLINRTIMNHKQKHLLYFFEREKYSYVPIVKDGNCGPRAISVFVWGKQNKYRTVREDVYLSQLKKLKEAHKNNTDRTVFDRKLNEILTMR